MKKQTLKVLTICLLLSMMSCVFDDDAVVPNNDKTQFPTLDTGDGDDPEKTPPPTGQ